MEKTIFRGIVRGKNIELEEAPPLPNGEPVTVEIHPQRAPGDGIRASAGAWAEAGEEFDQWLDDVYQAATLGTKYGPPMSFLIDTDTASAHLRGSSNVTSRFLQYTGRLYISTVSLAELKSWVYRKKTPAKYRRGLEDMLRDLQIVVVDEAVAEKSGEFGAALRDQGISIATPDLLIGGTAMSYDLTVVTHNVQDFVVIPGLRVIDWLQP